MAFTDPFEVTVVLTPHAADAAGPNLTSFPSMLPSGCEIPILAMAGFPCISK
jgi:hypothetical protein